MNSGFRLWLVLAVVLAPLSLVSAKDGTADKPQIQSGNLRIEFDNHLRSRVIARFDGKETVMGPFSPLKP